ncbi:MAG TPA: serine/threonine-protein kinase [Phytomonospora sp.]
MNPLDDADPRNVGSYRMLAVIGEGTTGRVLLGAAPDGKLVALKLIRQELTLDDGFRMRFRAEIDAARRVSGPFTASILDADPDAPAPWVATEFVHGPSLHEVLMAGGALPEDQALRLAAGVATGLTEVHQAGIAYRDLKPSNVILSPEGARIVGLGVAPTPSYGSPDYAEDVFALGGVVYTACTAVPVQSGYGAPDLNALPPRVRGVIEPCFAEPAARPSPTAVQQAAGGVFPGAQPWTPVVDNLAGAQGAAIGQFAGPQAGGFPSPPMMDPTTQMQAVGYEPAPNWQYSAPPAPTGAWAPPPPGYPMGPPPQKKNHLVWALPVAAAAVVVLVLVIALVVINNKDGDGGDLEAGETPTEWSYPDDETTTPTEDPEPTFDSNTLNDESTDETPIDASALLPDEFTDSEDVLYTLRSSGPDDCVQDTQESNVNDLLKDGGCDEMIVGTYVDHSDQILVAVMVMPLSDDDAAIDAYEKATDTYTQDWGIWCPADGETGDEVCDDGDWSSATMSGWISQQYRYLVHTTALYINVSQDSSASDWTDPAAEAAANAAGPQNYYDEL